MLEIRLATVEEADLVCQFYGDHIDAVQFAEYVPKWKKGSYPSDAYLTEAVKKQEMYIGFSGGRIAAAMILNAECNESYEQADWPVKRSPQEILVVHTLAVHLDFCRRGFGKAMLRKAVEVAKEQNKTALRLDTLHLNFPADRLYRGFGFQCVGEVPMYYEDTGWMNFKIYEYPLDKNK